MHDWILVSISLEWHDSTVIVKLLDHTSTLREIVARGVRQISVSHEESWGPSVSVLGYQCSADAGASRLKIEMQSGDRVDIQADSIDMPESAEL
jgi:hypothetical protein